MLHHVSVVQNVSIISLGITAVFQVGDANQMELKVELLPSTGNPLLYKRRRSLRRI